MIIYLRAVICGIFFSSHHGLPQQTISYSAKEASSLCCVRTLKKDFSLLYSGQKEDGEASAIYFFPFQFLRIDGLLKRFVSFAPPLATS
jgi:hypothetical protein